MSWWKCNRCPRGDGARTFKGLDEIRAHSRDVHHTDVLAFADYRLVNAHRRDPGKAPVRVEPVVGGDQLDIESAIREALATT